MEVLGNLDLLSVGIVVAATGVLGFTAYFRDRESITNQAFLLFSVITAFWGAFTYAEYNVAPDIGIWFLRLSLCFAVGQAYSIFLFFCVFPKREATFRWTHRYILVPIAGVVAVLTLTPYVLDRVTGIAQDGTISSIANGPAVGVFGAVAIIFVAWGLCVFLKKAWDTPREKRGAYLEILAGTSVTFLLIIIFNFILPAFFQDARFIPLGSFFMFPFVSFAAYAIFRENLFNVKVAITAVLVFLLSVVSFGEVIFSHTFALVLFRTSIFVIVLVVGISLIRSVMREVEQRERIQKLAAELQETNNRQELLIHFIGHEVKGFLTKDAGAFAALLDGDFGALPEPLKPLVETALASSRQGEGSVGTILKAANLKNGTVTYTKESFDLRALVTEVVDKAKFAAGQKGLAFNLAIDDASYQMTGDRAQLGDHVLRNLIDNAINYTLSGTIEVSLKRVADKLIFSVQDSGVGITDEDKKRLFTEGGHGADSQKVNVHSTGYGLFIAKSITEAHGGTIRAESPGAGKGSTFVVELPV